MNSVDNKVQEGYQGEYVDDEKKAFRKERKESRNVDREAWKVASSTPGSDRYHKCDTLIGSGSFKRVYKGLDILTGVTVAWCELKASE